MPPPARQSVQDATTLPGLPLGSRPSDGLRLLGQFAKQPRQVGAIAPSSPYLAREMIQGLELEQADEVYELGAGTGAFTALIASQLRSSARFQAFEINPSLALGLRRRLGPSIEVVCDSAANLSRHLSRPQGACADAIISSLPWASFDSSLQNLLLAEIHHALKPGASFVTFAYVHAAFMPGGYEFRGKLEYLFNQVERSTIVWRNLPPAFVYRCRR